MRSPDVRSLALLGLLLPQAAFAQSFYGTHCEAFGANAPCALYTIDLPGTATDVADVTLSAVPIWVDGLSWSGSTLHGFHNDATLGFSLVSIDPTTAVATTVGAPVSPGQVVLGGDYAPDGRLYVVTTDTPSLVAGTVNSPVYLAEVDPVSGALLNGPVPILDSVGNGRVTQNAHAGLTFTPDGSGWLALRRVDSSTAGDVMPLLIDETAGFAAETGGGTLLTAGTDVPGGLAPADVPGGFLIWEAAGPDDLNVWDRCSGAVTAVAADPDTGNAGMLSLTRISAPADTDSDSLPDWIEFEDVCSPRDTDGDGTADFDDADDDDDLLDTTLELGGDGSYDVGDSDWLNPDSDGDQLLDGLEITLLTDPLNPDSDGGGVGDGHEIDLVTDPLFTPDDVVVCGDGWVDPAESCDDNNALDGDGCSSTCGVEDGYECSTGDGSDGDYTASGPGDVVNVHAPLVENVVVGATALEVPDGSLFAVGNLLLVWQTQATGTGAFGAAGPIDAATLDVGQYEFVRVATISGDVLTLGTGLQRSYSAPGSQVVTVPEYDGVTIPAGTSIAAAPWDGVSGGVLIFKAAGTVVLDGALDASGAGFRGGLPSINYYVGGETNGVEDEADDPTCRTGRRGEGVVVDPRLSPCGTANIANGAGGGGRVNAGGGGGGHVGIGGEGSPAWPGLTDTVGGDPGVGLVPDPARRLFLGGGGGGGQQNNTGSGTGGDGGGVVFVQAANLTGAGSLLADGATGIPSTVADNDGGGGGGAGGTVVVIAEGDASCGLASSLGGNGSSVDTNHGSGAGGGGGLVVVQGTSGTCASAATGGTAGSPSPVTPVPPADVGGAGAVGDFSVDNGGTGGISDCFDVTPPDIPTVDSLLDNTGRPTLTGDYDAGDLGENGLAVTVDGVTYVLGVDAELSVDASNEDWALDLGTLPAPLADGFFEVSAEQTDAAGNQSLDLTVLELEVDATAPVAPTVDPQSTTDTTPVITGAYDPTDFAELQVTVGPYTFVSGDPELTLDAVGGTWSLDLTGNPLLDNTYDVGATQTDPAGNSSSDGTTDELEIDSTPPGVPTVDSQVTNDNTPVLTGSYDPSDFATLAIDVGPYSFVDADAALTLDATGGTWSLDLTGFPLVDNTYDVGALQTDPLGNTSADLTGDELVVDTAVPAAPTVNPLVTMNDEPTLTGSYDPSDIGELEVVVNGLTFTDADAALTLDATGGTWSLDLTGLPQPDNTYDVAATQTDASGANTVSDGTIDELTIDTADPTAPTVDALVTADNEPTVTGSYDPSDFASLTVVVAGLLFTDADAALTLDATGGTWSLDLTGNPLADAVYDVMATQADAAGNTASDATLGELTIDTTDPAIPTVDTLVTADPEPTVTGTYDPSDFDTLTVTVDGMSFDDTGAELTVDATTGTWSLDLTGLPLGDGTYDVQASQADAAGNSSADVTTDELTIDPAAAIPPEVDPLVTSNPEPTLTGTYDPTDFSELTVTVDSNVFTTGAALTVDPTTGTWALDLTGTPLIDGTYDVDAVQANAAGTRNTSDPTNAELTVDTVGAPAPTVDSLTTADPEPTLTGTYDPTDFTELTVTVNGDSFTTTDAELSVDPATGTWSLDLTGFPQPDGTSDVDAVQTDASGVNDSPDTTAGELAIDSTDPAVPTVDTLVTSDPEPTLTGTYDPSDFAELTVVVDGAVYTSADPALTLDPTGSWSLDLSGAPVGDGTYDVTATQTDPLGNTSADGTLDELTVDTTGPTAPIVDSLTTPDPEPTVTGSYDPSDFGELTVTVNGSVFTTADTELTVDPATGTWSLDLTGNPLPDGTYDVAAEQTDPLGNPTADATTDELVIDPTAAVPPTVVPQVTTDPEPTVTGTYDPSDFSELTVTVNGTVYTTADPELTVDATDGSWSLDLTGSPLPDGTYDVDAVQTNAAGNRNTEDPTGDELTVDSTAPAVPTVDALSTELTEPTLTGTYDPADLGTLTVTVDGTTYGPLDPELTLDPDGTWSLDLTGHPLVPGTYDVLATQTDAAGNSTPDGSVDEVVIEDPVDDRDSDGVPNDDEVLNGTDPDDPDTDGDGLTDGEELNGPSDALDADSDDDGLSDGDEVDGPDGDPSTPDGTDPVDADSDDDGLPDGLELGVETPVAAGASLSGIPYLGTDPAQFSPDTDPLTVTDPNDDDSDDDGLLDGDEDADGDGAWAGDLPGTDDDETDPNDEDTDGDGYDDFEEGGSAGPDSDGDGIIDALDLDSDDDGLPDADELLEGTNPTDPDTDGGGVLDGAEVDRGTDPLDPSDDEDPFVDTDGDGLSDEDEDLLGTDPNDPDSDDDGLLDGDEVDTWDTDPLDADSDDDGLLDGEEVDDHSTDPNDPDTDDGGVFDGEEVERGSDPLDPDDDEPGAIQGEYLGGACAGCTTGGSPGLAGVLLLGALFVRRRR